MATWKQLIEIEMAYNGDDWKNVEDCTLTEKGLTKVFDENYGSVEGEEFTVWTSKWVYFPAVYDGKEWCASVARNPNGVPTNHIGGQ